MPSVLLVMQKGNFGPWSQITDLLTVALYLCLKAIEMIFCDLGPYLASVSNACWFE